MAQGGVGQAMSCTNRALICLTLLVAAIAAFAQEGPARRLQRSERDIVVKVVGEIVCRTAAGGTAAPVSAATALPARSFVPAAAALAATAAAATRAV